MACRYQQKISEYGNRLKSAGLEAQTDSDELKAYKLEKKKKHVSLSLQQQAQSTGSSEAKKADDKCIVSIHVQGQAPDSAQRVRRSQVAPEDSAGPPGDKSPPSPTRPLTAKQLTDSIEAARRARLQPMKDPPVVDATPGAEEELCALQPLTPPPLPRSTAADSRASQQQPDAKNAQEEDSTAFMEAAMDVDGDGMSYLIANTVLV